MAFHSSERTYLQSWCFLFVFFVFSTSVNLGKEIVSQEHLSNTQQLPKSHSKVSIASSLQLYQKHSRQVTVITDKEARKFQGGQKSRNTQVCTHQVLDGNKLFGNSLDEAISRERKEEKDEQGAKKKTLAIGEMNWKLDPERERVQSVTGSKESTKPQTEVKIKLNIKYKCCFQSLISF